MTVVAAPAGPYRGLAPFEDSAVDALLFFGRERETEVLAANLMASHLTVLYGPSGVGKSSLLRAGVVRRLRELAEPCTVVVFDAWADGPARRLREAVADAGGVEPVGTLADTVAAASAAIGGEVYVVLDQLEEYFLYRPRDRAPGALANELPEALNRRDLRAGFLLCLREDALAKLDAFKTSVPRLFANVVRVDHLDREQARRAILGPLGRWNELAAAEEPMTIEPELVEAVLDGVEAGKVVQGPGGRGGVAPGSDRVETPYLQLVMQRLWEVEREGGSRTLRLETLERLGGAARIVEDHLERALATLSSAERDLAARIFHHLVTPSGAKIAHGTADLAEYAAASPDELAGVMRSLSAERIVRPVANGGGDGSAHEIFHDVLADAVLGWRARFVADRAVQHEREAARRRHRRLVLVVVVALLALAAMTATAVYALSERRDARAQSILVHARELGATAASRLPTDPELSLLLAVEAARLSPSAQAEEVLRDALISSKVRGVLRAQGPVTSATYSAEGSTIATASDDGHVRLYDAHTNRLVRALDEGTPVKAVAFSPDGRLLVAGGRNGMAGLWEVSSGDRLRTLRNGFTSVQSASFSPDGSRVLTAGGRHVREWEARSGARIFAVRHPSPVQRASFSADGRLVLTVGGDRTARLWSAADGRLLHQFGQRSTVTSAALSPGEELLATGGADGSVRVWDVRAGRLLRVLLGHVGPVASVEFSPRGLLVTASSDGTGRVWRPRTGDVVAILVGHTNPIRDAEFSPDGYSIVTASSDRTARVWKPTAGNLRVVLAGHTDTVRGASFSPNGRRVLTWSDDGTARVWDPQAQPALRILTRLPAPILGAALSPDGRLVLAAGREGASLVRADTGARVRALAPGIPVGGVAFSPDGRLAAATVPSGVLVWRVVDGRLVRRFAEQAPPGPVAFGPDGRTLAAGQASDLHLLGLAGRVGQTFHARGTVTSMAFSPDGTRLAAGSADNTARIWDVASGRLLHRLEGHKDDVTAITFSPDGRIVATASRDHRARLWDAETGDPLRVLVGHYAVVSGVTFSPDGRWLVTAGPSTAGLWEVSSGRLLLFLRGHEPGRRLRSAMFAPTGSRILTAGEDGTIRAWHCDICPGVDGLLALAEQRLAETGRALTPAERRLYLG
jgi:WD40 repeat protein